MRGLLQILLMWLVRLYRRWFSPGLTVLFGPLGGCRFEPTCSAYALHALEAHGPFRGSWLALKRLARCHPWGGCGHDPVPPPVRGCRTPGQPCEPPRASLAATPH